MKQIIIASFQYCFLMMTAIGSVAQTGKFGQVIYNEETINCHLQTIINFPLSRGLYQFVFYCQLNKCRRILHIELCQKILTMTVNGKLTEEYLFRYLRIGVSFGN